MARQPPFLDQVVWITGASSGIGEALAHSFAAAGARLILSARGEDALGRVAGACGSRHPVDIVPLDLSKPETLPPLAAGVLERCGRVDVMVHNAGIAHRGLAIDTPLAIDQRIMATNYFGPIALTKALLPAMVGRGAGRIVVLSSLSAKYGAPAASAYAASKHAVEGFFQSLRAEMHETGIRVTIIVPGFIRTSITAHALTGSGEAYGKVLSVHERGMPPEVCAARIVAATAAGRAEALIGGSEVRTVLMHRLFPRLLERIVRSHPVRARERLLAKLRLHSGRS